MAPVFLQYAMHLVVQHNHNYQQWVKMNMLFLIAVFITDNLHDLTAQEKTFSVLCGCQWIGTTVLGNKAFSIRWLVSADDVLKSRF